MGGRSSVQTFIDIFVGQRINFLLIHFKNDLQKKGTVSRLPRLFSCADILESLAGALKRSHFRSYAIKADRIDCGSVKGGPNFCVALLKNFSFPR